MIDKRLETVVIIVLQALIWITVPVGGCKLWETLFALISSGG